MDIGGIIIHSSNNSASINLLAAYSFDLNLKSLLLLYILLLIFTLDGLLSISYNSNITISICIIIIFIGAVSHIIEFIYTLSNNIIIMDFLSKIIIIFIYAFGNIFFFNNFVICIYISINDSLDFILTHFLYFFIYNYLIIF